MRSPSFQLVHHLSGADKFTFCSLSLIAYRLNDFLEPSFIDIDGLVDQYDHEAVQALIHSLVMAANASATSIRRSTVVSGFTETKQMKSGLLVFVRR